MEDVWVAALAINGTLLFCFLCCFRLFNCCIRYAGALKEYYDGDAGVDMEEDDEQPAVQRAHQTLGKPTQLKKANVDAELENIRRLRIIRAQQIAGSRRMWMPRSLNAYLTLFTLLVDGSALAAFSFSSSTPIASSTTFSLSNAFVTLVRSVAKSFLFQFTDESFRWTFWMALLMAVATIIVGIYVLIKDSKENSIPSLLFQVLGTVLLFPICSTLTSVLSCTYPETSTGDGQPYLAVLPSITCWESQHSGMVGGAMVVFVFYYLVDALLLARLVRSIIDDTDFAEREGQTAIYTDNRFMVFYFQAKICVSFVVAYWGTGDKRYSPWIVIVTIFILLCGLITYNYYSRPSNVDILNSLRTYTFVFALVINVCAIISVAAQNWNEIGHWLVFAGVLLWLIAVLVHFCSQYGCLECRIFEPNADGDMNESLIGAAAFCEPQGTAPESLPMRSLASYSSAPAPIGDSAHSPTGYEGGMIQAPNEPSRNTQPTNVVANAPSGSVMTRPSTSRVVYVNLSSSTKDSIVLI